MWLAALKKNSDGCEDGRILSTVHISMTPAGSHFIPAYQIDTPEPSQTFGFLRVHLTCPLLMYGYIHLYLRGRYPAKGVRSSFEKNSKPFE